MQQGTYQTKGLQVVHGGSGVPLARLALEFGEQEAELAAREGQLAFLARLLVQVTIPHSKPQSNEYERTNGLMTLSMVAPKSVGLPYGSLPRLLLAWLSTRAVQTRSREIYLGRTLNEFMQQLGLARTGGAKGDITRLKDQARRLFATALFTSAPADTRDAKGRRLEGVQLETFTVADAAYLAWHPLNPDQVSLEASAVYLSERFYESVIQHAVPLDKAILGALRRSPMALDIYAWLTWRLPLLKEPTVVAWPDLQRQFGAHYARIRDFRAKFLESLRAVTVQYPAAQVEPTPTGLILKPSRPSVPRLPRQG